MIKLKKYKMRSAVLIKNNSNLKILELNFNDQLKKGQVLVKIYYTGICGSQIGEIEGIKGKDKYLPHLLGHEATGLVIKIGKGVKKVKKNDKVILHWKQANGLSSENPEFFYKNKKINAGPIATFNEYAIVSENRLSKIPRGIKMREAVIFGCAATTGFGVVNYNAKIKKNESVVVFGSGGVGLNIIQSAYLKSAHPIIAVDIFENRLKFAKKFGATHFLNTKNKTNKLIFNEISKLTNNKGPDVFIDNTGNTKIIELGYSLINSKKGRLILVGVPNYKKKISIKTLPLHLGKKIIGSHGGNIKPNRDIIKIVTNFKENKVNLGKFYVKEYKLNQINKAISDMKFGKISGRCLIKM